MNPSLIGIALATVGFVGGVCGILSLIYQRRQARLMQRQLQLVLNHEDQIAEWAAKYDEADAALRKIIPGYIVTGSPSSTNAYGIVFPSALLRQGIERYLVHRGEFSGRLEHAPPTRDQLLNPMVQQVIQEVLDAVKGFKSEHVDWSQQLQL